MLRHLIFDLDGTLIDSKLDIIASLRLAFVRIGRKNIEIDENCIGLPLRQIAYSLDSSISENEFFIFQKEFRNDYDTKDYNATNLMKGVVPTLNNLATLGMNSYVATTKPSMPMRRVIDALGLSCYFQGTYSLDSLEDSHKTKADLIKRILLEKQIDPIEAAYIGDYPTDITAAHDCGITAIAYLNGYGETAELLAMNPDICIDCISDLSMKLVTKGTTK